MNVRINSFGVRHAVVFGSVARKEDTGSSDIDIFLDFGSREPTVSNLLKAEGTILDAFKMSSVDVVSDLKTPKGKRLKLQIEKYGIYAF